MSQTSETQNTAPNLQDKRKPAPGVLPKNAQTWVVIGLTTVIMLMLWISGPRPGEGSEVITKDGCSKARDRRRTQPCRNFGASGTGTAGAASAHYSFTASSESAAGKRGLHSFGWQSTNCCPG